MAILEIIRDDNPILRKKAIKVTSFDSKFQTLVDDMIETMREAPGVGLAAPQIGKSLRLAVVETLAELDDEGKQAVIQALEHVCHDLETPLQRIMHHLHPWVTFTIIPLFAFANAGVKLDFGALGQTITHPIALGIILGLLLGKQMGIFGLSWLAVKTGLARLPSGVTWGHVYGASWLGGIGFTMSLFIGALGFKDPETLELAKVGILIGSLVAGVGGYLILKRVSAGGKTAEIR